MRSIAKFFVTTFLVVLPVSALQAHEAIPAGSGFVHVISDPSHFSGFFVMGLIGGLFAYLFGARTFIAASFLSVAVLASHAHVPMITEAGVLFSMGFLSASLVIAFIAARVAVGAVRQLGIRTSEPKHD